MEKGRVEPHLEARDPSHQSGHLRRTGEPDAHLGRAQRIVPRELELRMEDSSLERRVLCGRLRSAKAHDAGSGSSDAPGPEIRQDHVKKSSSLTGPARRASGIVSERDEIHAFWILADRSAPAVNMLSSFSCSDSCLYCRIAREGQYATRMLKEREGVGVPLSSVVGARCCCQP